MGKINQVILANSAGYQFAQVRLDGHCDIAGGQGVGKTTLMNALLFPFVVEDRFIDIEKNEKERFSEYYFKFTNSFIIYEVENDLGALYCAVARHEGASLVFNLVSAPYDEGWLFNEAGMPCRDWGEVRQRIGEEVYIKTITTRDKFNRIFLGKGEDYTAQYSIIKTPRDKDSIRPLLANIFKNLPFTQDNLKESLVAAVMTSNNVETEGIALGTHRESLRGFAERYSDIQKVTVTDKDGKTAIDPIADEIFSQKDDYVSAVRERDLIPGKLAFAHSAVVTMKDKVQEDIAALRGRKDSAKKALDEKISDLAKKQSELLGQIGEVKKDLDTIIEYEKKYQDIDVDSLVEWIADKKNLLTQQKELESQRDSFSADAREINFKMKTAIENNTQVYRHKQNEIEAGYNKSVADLNAKRQAASDEADRKRAEIEKQYASLIGKDWTDTAKQYVKSLMEVTRKVEASETIEDAKAALSSIPESEPILSDVLIKRVGEGASLKDLKATAKKASGDLESHLTEKVKLEKKKADELAGVNVEFNSIKKSIDEQINTLASKKREDIAAVVSECRKMEAEIKRAYQTQLSGGDSEKQTLITELQENLESVNYQLEMIDKFPAAAEDKRRWLDRKPSVSARKAELNKEKIAIDEAIKRERAAGGDEINSLSLAITNSENELRSLETEIKVYESSSPKLKTATADSEPIETEQRPSAIIIEYNKANEAVEKIERTLPEAVRKLKSVLSDLDTFELGIGNNSSLNGFEDYLLVAEKLEARLQGDEESGANLNHYIDIISRIWIDEFKLVVSDLQPAEEMLLQIGKLCSEMNSFIKANNHSDCINYFRMRVDEEENVTDLVRLLRSIKKFWDENQNVLGYDTLFSSGEEPANKEAMKLLEQLHEELERTDSPTIRLGDMFEVRMDFSEMGNEKKNVLNIVKPASEGTTIILKAMLNMALLKIVRGKKQAQNSKLICPIDEINKISPRNLDALTEFASQAGMYIIGSGQLHTQTALDYSYNVWNEPAADGSLIKCISLDAKNSIKAYGI